MNGRRDAAGPDENRQPGVFEEDCLNGVFPPPGSVIVMVCCDVARNCKKLPRNTYLRRSGRRGNELRLADRKERSRRYLRFE